MAEVEEKDIPIKVDMNRVIEKLKADFAKELADLKHKLAFYEVALEDAIRDREEALAENQVLRGRQVQPPGD